MDSWGNFRLIWQTTRTPPHQKQIYSSRPYSISSHEKWRKCECFLWYSRQLLGVFSRNWKKSQSVFSWFLIEHDRGLDGFSVVVKNTEFWSFFSFFHIFWPETKGIWIVFIFIFFSCCCKILMQKTTNLITRNRFFCKHT